MRTTIVSVALVCVLAACVSPQTRAELDATNARLDSLRTALTDMSADDPGRPELERDIQNLNQRMAALQSLAGRERRESTNQVVDVAGGFLGGLWPLVATLFPAIGPLGPAVTAFLGLLKGGQRATA